MKLPMLFLVVLAWGVLISACGAPQVSGLRGLSMQQEAIAPMHQARVESFEIQLGQVQRSRINTFKFRLDTEIDPASLLPDLVALRNLDSDLKLSLTSTALEYDHVAREIQWTIDPGDPRSSLENGRYRIEFKASALQTTDPSYAFTSDFSAEFRRLHGDFDGDGVVQSSDTSILMAAWGPTNPLTDYIDLSGDSLINSVDLMLLLGLM